MWTTSNIWRLNKQTSILINSPLSNFINNAVALLRDSQHLFFDTSFTCHVWQHGVTDCTSSHMTSISRPIGHLEDSGVIVVIIRLAHLKKKNKKKTRKGSLLRKHTKVYLNA